MQLAPKGHQPRPPAGGTAVKLTPPSSPTGVRQLGEHRREPARRLYVGIIDVDPARTYSGAELAQLLGAVLVVAPEAMPAPPFGMRVGYQAVESLAEVERMLEARREGQQALAAMARRGVL